MKLLERMDSFSAPAQRWIEQKRAALSRLPLVERHSEIADLALASLCAVIALLVIERAIRDTLLWTSPVPYFDQVGLISLTNQWLTHTLPYQTIWSWHNDHLIPAPQLIYLGDIIFFRNRAIVLVLCSWTLLVSQAAALLYFTWHNLSFKFALFGSALILAGAFSPSQMENLTWGFQVAYWMGQVFGILAIVFLIRSLRARSSWANTVLAIFCGLVAAFSFGGGVVIWPCITILALKLPLRVTQKVLYICCGVFVFGALLWARAVQFPGSLGKRPSFGEAWDFLSALMGVTWSYERSSVSVIVTVVSLSLFILLLGQFFRSKSPSDLSILAVGGSFFSLFWIFSVIFGRVAFGVKFASSERYQTTALCFFVCLGLGLLEWAYYSQWPIVQALAVIFLGTVVAAIPTIHSVESSARSGAQYLQQVEAALKVGVGDSSFINGNLLYGPGTLQEFELSRQHDYSLFADREHRLLGQPLDEAFRLTNACPGRVLERIEIHNQYPGSYLRGEKGAEGHKIVVVSRGVIVGLGFQKIQAPHLWAAFARPTSGSLDVYAVSDHRACLVGTAGG